MALARMSKPTRSRRPGTAVDEARSCAGSTVSWTVSMTPA